jgi:hypothetical protein
VLTTSLVFLAREGKLKGGINTLPCIWPEEKTRDCRTGLQSRPT